jgi:hypothetical protein
MGRAAAVFAVAPFTDHWPARDAMDTARGYARTRGYAVWDGGSADFVTQPDTRGGCKGECSFGTDGAGDVVVRVRRSWVFGS